MRQENSPIYQLFSYHFEAPEIDFGEILKNAKTLKLPSNKPLLKLAQTPENIYLVEQGLLRAVFITEDGKEFSKEFYWENDIIFGMRSIISNQPLPYSIESIEPCYLYQLPLVVYQKLVSQHEEWKNYHIKQLEQHFLYKEFKEELLLLHSNQQKVSKVYKLFPELVKRVPATLVASYLGLTSVSLSRIKKRLNL
ncbi:Crp/Fnr family transcriptional regulator [Aliikangiella sp. IMCC44359]|uniref:Crp/Fnr family transcriptional regulator n=1 Tax=Aliikangiella sp. IMCC44359 TaxID=3459125 RepID=UPI00403AB3EB